MGEFLRKRRFVLAATLALLAGLTLYSRSLAGKSGNLSLPERGVLWVSYYPLKGVDAAERSVVWVWRHYVDLVGLREENDALRSIIRDLDSENTRLTEAALENDRLRKLVDFQERTGVRMLAARVIGEDVRQEFRSVLLDRGGRDGVGKDMAVVTAEGIVGRVIEVADRMSKVLLVLDHKSAVPAVVQRSRAKAIVKGTGDDLGSLRLAYLARLDDVQEGDIVITSGLGGTFPKGLVVGMVTLVNWTAHGMFKDAAAQPAVDFSRLEDVLVILDRGARADLELAAAGPVTQAAGLASAGEGASQAPGAGAAEGPPPPSEAAVAIGTPPEPASHAPPSRGKPPDAPARHGSGG